MINIDALDMNISNDEESYCFSFDAGLKRPADFNKFVPGTEVEIVFYGTTYKGIVDERTRTTEFGENTYRIKGRAVTSKLGESRSNTITRTWGNIRASQVVADLCAEVGIASDYQAYDWKIPKEGLSANDEHRIDVIKKIARATGSMVQTTHDGVLTILPKYKQPPTKLFDPDFEPDVVYEESNDIISLNESYRIFPKYNEVIVTNIEDKEDYWEIFEIESLDSTGVAILGVDVFPFKDSVSLKTSSSHVSISYLGKVEETKEDELVEIVNGEGQTSENIKSMVSSEYLTNDLGSISFNGTDITTTEKGNSLIRMTYKTEFHKFKVVTSSSELDPFQVYTIEEKE